MPYALLLRIQPTTVFRALVSSPVVLSVAFGSIATPKSLEGQGRVELQTIARTPSQTLSGLGLVLDAVAGPSGKVYILDPTRPGIVVTNRQLKPLGSFGRRGSGPGEFREPVSLIRLSYDRIAVLDRALGRVTVLATDGDGSSLRLESMATLNFTADGMCGLAPDTVLIHGYHGGYRLHILDAEGRHVRSFAPPDTQLSPMALGLRVQGRIACELQEDEVLVTSRFWPVVEAFRVRSGHRFWIDTLSPFRPVHLTDRGASVSIESASAGASLIRNAFNLNDYRVFQTVYDSRTDGVTIDSVLTYLFDRQRKRWLPVEHHLPVVFKVDSSTVLSLMERGDLELDAVLSRIVIRARDAR